MKVNGEDPDPGSELDVTRQVKQDLLIRLDNSFTVETGENKVHGSVGMADIVVWKGKPHTYRNQVLVIECKGSDSHRAAIGDAITWAHNQRDGARAGVAFFDADDRIKNVVRELPLFGWDVSDQNDPLFTMGEEDGIESMEERFL